MFASVLFLDLRFFDTRTLKEKRSGILRLKSLLRKRFAVSVSETDHHELWQRGQLGLLFWSPDPDSARRQSEAFLGAVEAAFDGEVTGHRLERLS